MKTPTTNQTQSEPENGSRLREEADAGNKNSQRVPPRYLGGYDGVLERGSPLPLSVRANVCQRVQSARGPAHSETSRRFTPYFCFLVSTLCFVAHAQFSIDWFTIDGGGGTSTGGVYSVTGTIGQPDAGSTMSGGNYSVDGGFWSLIAAVQSPGAPTLTIAPATPGNATLSWSPNTPGFVLQERLSLSSGSWSNSPSAATNPIVVPTISPTKFYRLFKP